MDASVKWILFWAPRILCILFALFLSLFAGDVFREGYGFWKTILALLVHLVPTFVVILALVVGWRWEWIGAILFLAFAIFYWVWNWGRFPFLTYLIISGPLFLAGVLFLINWMYRAELRTR